MHPVICFSFDLSQESNEMEVINESGIFINFRCQIAVHQECYGVRGTQDFTSWVCRACETPDIKRECCLCPVKGTYFSF
jgi:PHD-finger